MYNKGRKFIICSLFLIGLLLTASNSIAVPFIKNIQFTPITPKPLDEMTFNVDVEYFDFAKGVYLVVDEFKDDLALIDGINESMDDKGNGVFEKKIQLMHLDATQIKYHFVINVQNYPDVDWTESEIQQLDLDTSMTRAYDPEQDDNTNNNNEDANGKDKSPGFELIFLIIALGIILYFRKKK